MRQVATGLSSEERQAVATYLASLTASGGPPH
jgi:cytochrome c553